MVEKMRIGIALQPVATALFANSPFRDGSDTGEHKSHDSLPPSCQAYWAAFEPLGVRACIPAVCGMSWSCKAAGAV